MRHHREWTDLRNEMLNVIELDCLEHVDHARRKRTMWNLESIVRTSSLIFSISFSRCRLRIIRASEFLQLIPM